MKIVDICPISVFQFNAPDELIDTLLFKVETSEFVKNERNAGSKFMFYEKDMVNWLDECILKVGQNKYPDIEKFVITGCWVNKTTKFQSHHYHTHPNSLFSGILYLTTHETGYTNFYSKDAWYNYDENLLWFAGKQLTQTNIISSIKPEKGKLIIFPSHLAHDTKQLIQNETRYSISFNVFVSGHINKDQVHSKLILNTRDYREDVIQSA